MVLVPSCSEKTGLPRVSVTLSSEQKKCELTHTVLPISVTGDVDFWLASVLSVNIGNARTSAQRMPTK